MIVKKGGKQLPLSLLLLSQNLLTPHATRPDREASAPLLLTSLQPDRCSQLLPEDLNVTTGPVNRDALFLVLPAPSLKHLALPVNHVP